MHRVSGRIEDEDKRLKAVSHPHGVALAAAVLAEKRGEGAVREAVRGVGLCGCVTGHMIRCFNRNKNNLMKRLLLLYTETERALHFEAARSRSYDTANG